jgi:hypothetical protein
LPPPKRRWPRRIRRLVIAVLLLAVISRIVVAVAFPIVLRRVAGFYGLNCSYDRMELSMLSGDAGLWHLTFTPKGDREPIFSSEYIFGDISTLNLLRGRLAVWRVEADGVNILIDRNADGSIPILKMLTAKASTATPVNAPPTSQPARPIDLAAPLRIDALRLTHVKAHVRDQSVSPPLDATFTLNLRLSNLGSTSSPVHFAVDMDADPIIDAMHIEGDGHGDAKSLEATLQANVDGLRLHPLAPYLRALGVVPTANEISLKAGGRLKLEPAAANPSLLAGLLQLDDLTAVADGEEAAGLNHLALGADSIDTRTIQLGTLSIDQARLNGRRSADGRIRFGGVEFVGAPPSTEPSAPTVPTTITLPAITLAGFDLKHLHAGFHDDAMTPTVAVGVDVNDLRLKHIVFDPRQPDAEVQLSGAVSAPGVFKNALFQGTAKPFAAVKTLHLGLRADGIEPTTLAPYLARLGIRSDLHDASFVCDVSADVSLPAGGIAADAKLKGIKLTDSTDLLALDHVDVAGASYQLNPPLIRLHSVEIAGPVLSIAHEANGSLTAAGFATATRTSARVSTPSKAPASAPQPAALPILPSLQIDHLAWNGIDIHYADRSIDPPAATELSDAGVELNNILLNLSDAPTTQAAAPGTIHAWAKVPNLIDHFSVEGSVVPSPAAMACNLTIAGTGFTAGIIAPYLKSIGIEPTFRDGAFAAEVKADVSHRGVSLDAERVRLSDGDQELAGVDTLKIGDTSIAGGLLNIGGIEIDRPRIGVTHETDGAFLLAGIRLSPSLFSRSSAPDPAVTPTGATPARVSPATAPAFALPFDVALNGLQVKQAALKWTDRAVSPNVQTAALANLTLSPIRLGKSAAPTQLHADAHLDGSLDSAAVDGTITPSLDSPEVKLNVSAKGLRAGSLASYLPPAISVGLRDGQFHSSIEAGAAKNPLGGMSAKFVVTNLDYRDQGQSRPLLKVDSFRAIASRIDPAQKVYAVDEVSSAGVETAASRSATGAIQLLGVALKAAQPAPAPPTTRAAEQAPPTSTSAPADVAALVAQARQRAPVITLNKLDLNLKHLWLTDGVRPAAAPLIISDLRFRNTAPLDWGGKDAQTRAPTPFRMDCTLDPVVGAVTVTAQVAPLAATPTAVVDLTAADINGDGLTSLVPELKPYIDGSALENGLFHAHVETQFRVNRKGTWDIDLSRGLSMDLDVKDIAFHARPDGPVIAGLDGIHSDAIFIRPATGEVHVKTLEITDPIGRVVRQKDGIHVLGLVVKLPQTQAESTSVASTQATSQPTTQTVRNTDVQPPTTQVIAFAKNTAATQPLPKKPAGEIRVDQLLISGVDFVAEDQTMTPPLIVPLNALDVEVRDFSNFAPYEDKPIRFNALVNAGKVPLPKKLEGSGIGGALGDAAKMMAGGHVQTKPQVENRELFAQASANGQIGLFPTAHGWIKTSVSGLELAGLSGVAREEGVTLTGGVFDSTADARLPGDGTIRTNSHFTFTDLALSEPPNGPIFRFLHLPAPLDVVVGALQDQEGSITVPIAVPVPMQVGKLSVSDLVGPAVGAFGSIVATAIASAPLKAAGGFADLLGLGGNKKHAPEPPIVLAFEPGYTGLSPEDHEAIATIAQRMIKDKSLNLVVRHELGGGDLAVADERANPSKQDAQNLAERLRQQQMDALQQRSNLAGIARAELAWGSSDAADATIDRLRNLDRQVAQNDDAMDRLYALLRPGADRQSQRRTRGACLEYGHDRLAAVKHALEAAGLADMDRVHIASPQFEQATGDAGGTVVVTLVPKKKS